MYICEHLIGIQIEQGIETNWIPTAVSQSWTPFSEDARTATESPMYGVETILGYTLLMVKHDIGTRT